MPRETVLALDLEGTLISNAVSQLPRPGLYAFLEFCRANFERVYLHTAVRHAVGEAIVRTLVSENSAPEWFLGVPFVQWDHDRKDLDNIPDARPCDCLLADDNREYVVDDQLSQWIPIAKYESPYPDAERELERVRQVIVDRFRMADIASGARKHFEVRSARNAEFFRSDRPWAAISISSREDHPVLDEQNRVGLLQMVFEDTATPDNPRAFTQHQAEDMLDFVERIWDKVETHRAALELAIKASRRADADFFTSKPFCPHAVRERVAPTRISRQNLCQSVPWASGRGRSAGHYISGSWIFPGGALPDASRPPVGRTRGGESHPRPV